MWKRRVLREVVQECSSYALVGPTHRYPPLPLQAGPQSTLDGPLNSSSYASSNPRHCDWTQHTSMVDTSNQIKTLKQWFLVLGLLIPFLAIGCSGNPLDDVYGQYRIDETRQFEGMRFQELKPVVRQSVQAIAKQLNDTLVYEFADTGCQRVINGQKIPFICEFVKIEKRKIVVFRSKDESDRTRYLRLTPSESGVTLDNGITSIALRRIK